MFNRFNLMGLALAASVAVTPLMASAAEITVFAAASLKNALDTIAAEYSAKTGDTLAISYESSGKLAKQIQAGAPADLFISAAINWMDAVQESGDIQPETRQDLLGNDLVLIGAPDAEDVDLKPGVDLAALLDGGKLAMGMVDSVPAGMYGKEALTSLGIWETVAPDVAQTDNVRAALALVSAGEAPFGIVYSSDAVSDSGVRVVGIFPADSHAPIVYPAALTTTAKPEAAAFLSALKTPEAAAAFKAQGFEVLGK